MCTIVNVSVGVLLFVSLVYVYEKFLACVLLFISMAVKLVSLVSPTSTNKTSRVDASHYTHTSRKAETVPSPHT